MQLKFNFFKFVLHALYFLFTFKMKCNLLFDMDVLYPYFVLDDYILLSFSCTIHKPTIFWPNSCISYVLTYILFFLFPHFLIFLLHCCFPSPFHPSPFVLTCPFPDSPQIPTPFPVLSFAFLVLVYIPCCHSQCSCFCAWTKCSSDQLAPINRLEPWSMTTSPFCGIHPSLWMICSSPLFLDSSLFLSYAACSSLLLKMVTPQSLFTLFGMLSLALYFYYWFNYVSP